MRGSALLFAVAAAGTAILACSGGLSPAAARMTLAQCRSNEVACHRTCLLGLNGQPATLDTVYGLKQCLNKCDANHAACVDFVFSNFRSVKIDQTGGGSPGRRPAFDAGLLGADPGFATQAPSGTGSPLPTPPKGGAGPSLR